ncbi:ATPase [Marinobacteraceae bacterium S3BR75-40.1]
MEIRTFGDLIDWTRALHGHLAYCMKQGASHQKGERAKYLLEYLSEHEAQLEYIVSEFEHQAAGRVLSTRLYEFIAHHPLKPGKSACEPYGSLSFDEICRLVFDFHDQVIDLYKGLLRKAEIREAADLVQQLLDMEEHEAMRLARQVGSMEDL